MSNKAEQHRQLADKLQEEGVKLSELGELGPDALNTLKKAIQGRRSLSEKEVLERKKKRAGSKE